MRPKGAAYRFEQNDGSSAWTSIETADTLTQTASGWRLKLADSDAIETYNASGKLVSIQQRNGLKTTLKYDTQGQLICVTNPYGRFLTFEYYNAWHLTRIKTSGGEHYTLAYDANGNLSTITYPDQPGRQFHYESTQHLNSLTGVTDEAGQRIGTYSYHADGRVYDTQRALGRGRTQFTYTRDAQGLPQTLVTRFTAQGAAELETYNFITRGRVTRPANISLPAGQSGVAQHIEYDAKGHKSKVITHDGRVTFYTYNAKGRVTREATYPASYQSATTQPPLNAAEHVYNTQWHSTWNLPLKVAEAYLITSDSYDSKGNLLELIETPTTDPTGAKGFNATPSDTTYTTRWTYDANNLPMTIVELEGSTETGRWEMVYNASGDLTRITHVTSGTLATLSPVGNGESRVTAISDTGAVALLRSRSGVLSLAQLLVAPAEATSPALRRILTPYFAAQGRSIAVGVIISAAKFHPAIRAAGMIITAAASVIEVRQTSCTPYDPERVIQCHEFNSGHSRNGWDPHYHIWTRSLSPNDCQCYWNRGSGTSDVPPVFSST